MSVAAPERLPEFVEVIRDDVTAAYEFAEWLSGDELPVAPHPNRHASDRIKIIFETDNPREMLENVRRCIGALSGDNRQIAALIISGFPESLIQTYGSDNVGTALDALRDAYAVLPESESEPMLVAFDPIVRNRQEKSSESNGETDDFEFDDSPGDEEESTQEELEYLKTTDTVRWYMKETGKRKLLSAVEEVELAKQIEVGLLAAERSEQLQASGIENTQLMSDLRTLQRAGERAKDTLLEANLRLVIWVARRYQGRGLELLDLIQEGNTGLVRAVEKFDYTKGFKFSTYATWWIRQSITRGIEDTGNTIRLPVHKGEKIRQLRRFTGNFFSQYGREPSHEEIAVEFDISEDVAARLVAESRMQPISLDVTLGEDGDMSLADLIEDGDIADPIEATAQSELNNALDEMLDGLTPLEATMARLRFGLADGKAHTLDQIGLTMGVTRERVRQIESRIMAKLRHPAYKASSPLVSREVNQEWRQDAECKEAGIDKFFHPHGERGVAKKSRAEKALRYCGRCAVIDVCREQGVRQKEIYGIRAGMSEPDFQRYQLGNS